MSFKGRFCFLFLYYRLDILLAIIGDGCLSCQGKTVMQYFNYSIASNITSLNAATCDDAPRLHLSYVSATCDDAPHLHLVNGETV
jgi:hypothetical protein